MKKYLKTFLSKFMAFLIIFTQLTTGFTAPMTAKGETTAPVSINLGFVPKQSIINPNEPVIYSIDAENQKLYSINYETGDISYIQLSLTPERLYFANNQLYIAFLRSGHQTDSTIPQSGAIGIVDPASFTLKEQFDVDIDPYDMAVDKDGIIYITSGSTPYACIKSYSGDTKTMISSISTSVNSSIVINTEINKIYLINQMVYPVQMEMYTTSAGILNGPDYPVNTGNYSLNSFFKLSPDNKYMFDGSGTVVTSDSSQDNDMRYYRKLGTTFSDIAFDATNNIFYTLTGEGRINAYDYSTFQQLGGYYTSGAPEALFYRNNELIYITKASDNSYTLETIPADTMIKNPSSGSLTADKAVNTGNYTLTINIPQNSNATSYRFYEGTNLETSGSVDGNGLAKSISFSGKAPGTYIYKLETINSFNSTFSNQLTVTVMPVDSQPYAPVLLSFTPKQVIMDPVKPVAYAINADGRNVYAINLETRSVTSLQLDLQPERLYYANNELYVAMVTDAHSDYSQLTEQGAVEIIDTDTMTLKDQFDVGIDPFDIAVDGDYIYITNGSNQWNPMRSYSISTKQEIGSAMGEEKSYVALNASLNKIYTLYNTTDRTIGVYTISSGVLTSLNKMYSTDYYTVDSTESNFKISPDDKYLFNGNGVVFTCDASQDNDMKVYKTLNRGFNTIAFDLQNNMFFTGIDGGKIYAYDYSTFQELGGYNTSGDVMSLFQQNGKLISLIKTSDNSYMLETTPEDSLIKNPLAGSLTVDKSVNSGDYTITINIPQNSNATNYRLYNGTDIETSGFVDNSGLTRSISISGRAPGTYIYKLETFNSFSSAESSQLTVTVTDINPEPYSPTMLSFTPKQVIMDPASPVAYVINAEGKTLYSINLETKNITSLQFDLAPERMYFANNELYVALVTGSHEYSTTTPESGAVAVIDPGTMTLKEQFDVNIDPFDIAADSNNIYITGGSNQWTQIKSYSRATKQEVGNTSIGMEAYAAISPSMNKIYTISMDDSPMRIQAHPILNGTFTTPGYDWPYHWEYNLQTNFRLSPDGLLIFDGSGDIFMTSNDQSYDMTHVYSLGSSFNDIAFNLNDNVFYTGGDDGIIKAYDYDTIEELGTLNAMGKVKSLFYQGGRIISLTQTADGKWYIEAIDKSSMTPVNMPTAYHKIELNSSITGSTVDVKTNKAYTIDNINNTLSIINLNNNEVEKTINLLYKPSALCLSEDGSKLYIANDDNSCLVTELTIDTLAVRYMNFSAPPNASSVAHKHIYEKNDRLYVVTGENSPELLVFDANTLEQINYSPQISGVGGMAFTGDGSSLYTWWQTGWDTGDQASGLIKYNIGTSGFTKTDEYSPIPSELVQAPFDTPIMPIEDKQSIIFKDRIFDMNNLNNSTKVFTEPIYAINPAHTVAAGKKGLYNLDGSSYLPFPPAHELSPMFFNGEGVLYANYGSTIYAVTPLVGDMNGDSSINIEDVALAAQSYGATKKDSRYNFQRDMNNDGVIDLFDLVLVSKKLQ